MRPLLAVILSVVILGGLWAYTGMRTHGSPSVRVIVPDAPQERFAAELTLTFSAEADPFALNVDEAEAPAAVLVRFNGQQVLRITERLVAGDPVEIDPLPGAVIGDNELFLEANPPVAQGNQAHAVRVRITRDDVPIVEKTFWSEPGTRLSVRFPFEIRPPVADEAIDDHEH